MYAYIARLHDLLQTIRIEKVKQVQKKKKIKWKERSSNNNAINNKNKTECVKHLCVRVSFDDGV